MLLLVVAGSACGPLVLEPLDADGSSGTTDVAQTSTSPVTATTSVTTSIPPEITSSTTGDDTTGDDTTDETGVVFLLRPDGGGPCGNTEDGYWHCSFCDVVAQDCGEGEKCVPWANDGGGIWNATRCTPIPDDPAAVGEPCVAEGSPTSGIDDCDLGAMCWEVDSRTLQGTCTALCYDDGLDPCAEGMDCAAYNYFAPSVCLSRCDPLDPATCPADEVCRDLGEEAICVPTIVLPQGLTCGTDETYCAPEQACLFADELASCAEGSCCTAWCDLSAPDPDLPCAAVPGEVCRPFFEDPLAGYEHVGVCGLPG